MKVMSLFAGIGGFDLAAAWMGWETVVQVELDEWCRKVLAKNFPNAHRHDDIKTFDGTKYRGTVDLVCGGFPCQPVSHAGRRKGTKDDRFLWHEMLRTVRDVSPRWVVGENVSGLLSQDAGLVFESLLTDLEDEGYTVWPYLLPACGVNAPHKRERVWIIAHRNDGLSKSAIEQIQSGWQPLEFGGDRAHANTNGIRSHSGNESTGWEEGPNPTRSRSGPTLAYTDREREQQPERSFSKIWRRTEYVHKKDATNTTGVGCQRAGCSWPAGSGFENGDCHSARDVANTGSIGRESGVHGQQSEIRETSERRNGDPSEHFTTWPTQSPLCTRNDGVPIGLVRSARIRIRAFQQWRARVIKAAGNAIVPQVALQIFKAINEVNQSLNTPITC